MDLRNSNGFELRNFYFTTIKKLFSKIFITSGKCIMWSSIQALPNQVSKKSFYTFEDIKLQLHDAIYRLRFHSNSLIHILSLSNSHNNLASIQKNRDDKSHRVTVALRRISCHGRNHSQASCEYSLTIFLCCQHHSEYSLLGSKFSTNLLFAASKCHVTIQ